MAVTIDNTDISTYGAALLTFDPGMPEIANTYLHNVSMRNVRPIRLIGEIGLREILLEIEVYGDTEPEAVTRMSNLCAAIRDGSELDVGDGFGYYYVVDSFSKPERVSRNWYTFSAILVGYRHGRTQTATYSKTGNLLVAGNYDAPAIFRITKTSGTTFTVNGITYTGTSGAEDPVVVDGYARTVMQSGQNVFGRMSMTAFPVLTPGANTITITGTGTVAVEYQPIFM